MHNIKIAIITIDWSGKKITAIEIKYNEEIKVQKKGRRGRNGKKKKTNIFRDH